MKTIEQVTQLFFERGLTITGEYHDTHTPVKCSCNICGNVECCTTYSSLQQGRGGCLTCAKEKRKKTCLEKYGTEFAQSSTPVKEKQKKTNLERYGVVSTAQSAQVKEKAKQTCLERYGTDCVLLNKDIQEKIKQTNLEKYGSENPMQNEEIRKKGYSTNLERYGVEHPLQHKTFCDKAALAQNDSFVFTHWKTGEELIARGNYERSVIEYWNNIKEDYKWQVEFTMPDGRIYIVDAYLPSRNLYIEIKGRHQGDSEEKWNWFHNAYPNSEIWFKENLESMGLKTRRRK
jgi:hypothetical protein